MLVVQKMDCTFLSQVNNPYKSPSIPSMEGYNAPGNGHSHNWDLYLFRNSNIPPQLLYHQVMRILLHLYKSQLLNV